MYADSEKNFKGLFYHDEEMRNMFSAYPEIVFIDATCKLNDLRLPLYVMMVVHGNGESEIVGLMLVADTIRQITSYFKTQNPNWSQINCTMVDKDLTRAPSASR